MMFNVNEEDIKESLSILNSSAISIMTEEKFLACIEAGVVPDPKMAPW